MGIMECGSLSCVPGEGAQAFFPLETLINTKYENEQKRGKSRPETVRVR